MSHNAGDLVLHLDRFVDQIIPVTGKLYVPSTREMRLAGSDLHWKHGQAICLLDARVGDVALVIERFVPPLGGGAVCWVVDATVRGRVGRSENNKWVACLTDIEEVELRDDWLTARMRLRNVP